MSDKLLNENGTVSMIRLSNQAAMQIALTSLSLRLFFSRLASY